MTQLTQKELEQVYNNVDPWGYQTNPADIFRKDIIINTLQNLGPFKAALDIGCGEGWITKDIPARLIFGTEASTQAITRWPNNIFKYVPTHHKYDLVMTTGTLYYSYHWEEIINVINSVASKYILLCNIAAREVKEIDRIEAELIKVVEFPYHGSPEEMFTQRLRIYKK